MKNAFQLPACAVLLVSAAVVSMFGLGLAATAAADPISGPEPGSAVAALPVFAATGSAAEKELDYAQQRGDKPTVYVFILQDRWGRPAARFLCELDQKLRENAADSEVVVVWLTGDVDAAKAYLPKAQMSLRMTDTALTVFQGAVAGPEGWAINDQADLTAVVANKGKVAARFGFVSVNETVVPDVLAELKKATEAK
jgi:hypothetical protein